tara:strand:+ start:205 stop:2052 length:1848 start_codon:yes stop_codon:yes gene_type:complete
MTINILGISCFYHDSAAALISDGQIVAAAQEERFSRRKHDPGFPVEAIQFCLHKANLELADVHYIVFYDKPLVKFERLLETYFSYAPRGIRSFFAAMPVWLKEKLFIKKTLRDELSKLSSLPVKSLPPLLFTTHHQAHAASAFFPSPFERAAVFCADGVGEWATTSVWLGEGNELQPKWQIDFPHSLGLLYSAITYFCGFKVNSGEYKLMGLAPYGEPRYVDLIYEKLLDLKDDGSFRLNMKYFNYAAGLTMTNNQFDQLFAATPRKAESELSQMHMDLARSVQEVIEEAVLRICRRIQQELKVDNLVMAGGVALNCVSNGRLQREGLFRDLWIQPAAGDAGGALGAALSVWHEYLGKPRAVENKSDSMRGSYLGPTFENKEISDYLDGINAPYQSLPEQDLLPAVAALLADEKVVGWFQGPMEFGPRALGGRSILGDPRSSTMQSTMNLKIKYRESFRPFAPSVKCEKVAEWFDQTEDSPYMLLVSNIKEDKRIAMTAEQEMLFGVDKLKVARSILPAITHVDYSARIQTVHKESNPRYWSLLDAFEAQTDCPVLINTSFNVRGEPIVCTPEDAYRCFMRTEMDYLVMENQLLDKSAQPPYSAAENEEPEFDLD